MARVLHWTKSLAKMVGDAVWPPVCPSCEGPVFEHGSFCATCWEKLRLISQPQCYACGIPFAYDVGTDALCGECTRQRPPFSRARAFMAYDDNSKSMILSFKHADRTDLAKPFASLMARAAHSLICDADAVVPVPLHWRRRLDRRYNQSALLAARICKETRKPLKAEFLQRVKASPSQGRKSPSARRRNVQGAFRVPVQMRATLRDKRILLVDDVLTTGATVEACTRALLRSGAAAVDVITFARVIREGL